MGSANGSRDGRLGDVVTDVADRARGLVRLEAELAAAELTAKLKRLQLGIVLLSGAAVLGLFGTGVLVAAVAASIALVLPWWAALLIVSGLLLGIAALLVAAGVAAIRAATPPLPTTAVEEARATLDELATVS